MSNNNVLILALNRPMNYCYGPDSHWWAIFMFFLRTGFNTYCRLTWYTILLFKTMQIRSIQSSHFWSTNICPPYTQALDSNQDTGNELLFYHYYYLKFKYFKVFSGNLQLKILKRPRFKSISWQSGHERSIHHSYLLFITNIQTRLQS